MENNIISLDGKKVIFIGNSFIYYGGCVLGKSAAGYPNISKRVNDKGFFYQLCRQNCEDVSVTNWTFDGHRFSQTFSGEPCSHKSCVALGTNHLEELTDRYYDYAILSEGSGLECDSIFKSNIINITEFFRKVNPSVKFVYLAHASAYAFSYKKILQPNVLNSLKELYDEDFKIVEWGALVRDIAEGRVAVPSAVEEYNKNTFLIAKSEEDGYHPNQLSGYITALMTYSAITGRSALGQSYEFCGDRSYCDDPMYRTFTEYRETYYKVGDTNYDRVFASDADMRGIQRLIDVYLNEKQFKNYNF